MTTGRRLCILGPLAALMLLCGCLRQSELPPPDCMPHEGACIINGVSLSFSPVPVRAMRELYLGVSLSAQGAGALEEMPDTVTVDFSMPGMNMAENRTTLKKVAPGAYEGKAVLPRCSSGQRLWRASVQVPVKGEKSGHELAAFLFEAI